MFITNTLMYAKWAGKPQNPLVIHGAYFIKLSHNSGKPLRYYAVPTFFT